MDLESLEKIEPSFYHLAKILKNSIFESMGSTESSPGLRSICGAKHSLKISQSYPAFEALERGFTAMSSPQG